MVVVMPQCGTCRTVYRRSTFQVPMEAGGSIVLWVAACVCWQRETGRHQ
jgi:hypothetical protein